MDEVTQQDRDFIINNTILKGESRSDRLSSRRVGPGSGLTMTCPHCGGSFAVNESMLDNNAVAVSNAVSEDVSNKNAVRGDVAVRSDRGQHNSLLEQTLENRDRIMDEEEQTTNEQRDKVLSNVREDIIGSLLG